MKYDVKLCELVRTAEIAADTYDFTVRAPELAAAARPGQFAHIYVPGRTLRRPISICDIDRENGTLRFVFQIRGAARPTSQNSRPAIRSTFWPARERLFHRAGQKGAVCRRRHRRAPAARRGEALR
ncbi:MAG: hypothetical protein ACLT3G_07455 [Acutalibacteraceae bacterium]